MTKDDITKLNIPTMAGALALFGVKRSRQCDKMTKNQTSPSDERTKRPGGAVGLQPAQTS